MVHLNVPAARRAALRRAHARGRAALRQQLQPCPCRLRGPHVFARGEYFRAAGYARRSSHFQNVVSVNGADFRVDPALAVRLLGVTQEPGYAWAWADATAAFLPECRVGQYHRQVVLLDGALVLFDDLRLEATPTRHWNRFQWGLHSDPVRTVSRSLARTPPGALSGIGLQHGADGPDAGGVRLGTGATRIAERRANAGGAAAGEAGVVFAADADTGGPVVGGPAGAAGARPGAGLARCPVAGANGAADGWICGGTGRRRSLRPIVADDRPRGLARFTQLSVEPPHKTVYPPTGVG